MVVVEGIVDVLDVDDIILDVLDVVGLTVVVVIVVVVVVVVEIISREVVLWISFFTDLLPNIVSPITIPIMLSRIIVNTAIPNNIKIVFLSIPDQEK